MGKEHKKIKHPNCPECGKPMRIIVPINMAVCDECGKKYYVEKSGDEYVVLGEYNKVKAEKMKKDLGKKDDTDWVEGNTIAQDEEKSSEHELNEKTEEEEKEVNQEQKSANMSELPPIISTDSRVDRFKEYVDQYVTKRFWLQVAKDELKAMVSELYDAGALGNSFNPSRVAKQLSSIGENNVLSFYGVSWLDQAVTKELMTRIWLKLQGYKEVMKIEKLKYYIAIFHPEDLSDFVDGKLSEVKVKKYIYEMEAID